MAWDYFTNESPHKLAKDLLNLQDHKKYVDESLAGNTSNELTGDMIVYLCEEAERTERCIQETRNALRRRG